MADSYAVTDLIKTSKNETENRNFLGQKKPKSTGGGPEKKTSIKKKNGNFNLSQMVWVRKVDSLGIQRGSENTGDGGGGK